MESDKSLRWLIPVCAGIVIIVMIIDIGIKNMIINEADRIRTEMMEFRNEYLAANLGSGGNPADVRNHLRTDNVARNGTVAKRNGRAKVSGNAPRHARTGESAN